MRRWMIAGFALVAAASACGVGCAQPAGNAGLRQACQADVAKLCAGVMPGGGRIMQCMRQHQDKVSDACKSAMSNAHGARQGQSAPSATPSPQG
jgi:hypothetical protein